MLWITDILSFSGIGDEIVSVNGKTVKGRTKVEVAKLIQASKVNILFIYWIIL